MSDYSYTIAQLADNAYLMPYGQAIADHRRTITTNEAGVLLWKAFVRGASPNDMLALLKETYEASDEELPILEQDLHLFMKSLEQNGIASQGTLPQSGYPATAVSIGPVGMLIHGPAALISTYFAPFTNTNADYCQELHILPFEPFTKPNGTILTRSMDLVIFETEDAFVYLPTHSTYVYEMHVTKDAKKAFLYADMHTESNALFDELFHMIRFAFLMAAQANDLLVVHSASILYDEKAYLFSGHSGAGKSTHTKLWVDAYNTPLLNGDLNMLGIADGHVLCYGLPWCGTSGTCTDKAYPFGGITYLFQDKDNKASKISYDAAVLQLTKRCINPSQTEAQLQHTFTLAAAICKLSPAFELYCTKEPIAAAVMKNTIDYSS